MQLQLVSDAVRYGPFYALAKSTIESPEPIDAAETWEFWTKDRNSLVTYLAEHYPPRFFVDRLIDRISDDRNLSDIVKHYELPAELFTLFLDEKYHFYSCAEYRSPSDTLEQAQINKAEEFLSLIAPKPGDRLLELGCGWGGMMKFLHERLGDSVTVEGITISRTQADFIKKSCGFEVEVGNFVTREYPENQYDHIYSIDAWDHVRSKDTPWLVKKLYGALKPGGRLVQQFGCETRPRFPATFLLAGLFFSGLVPKSLAAEVAAAEAAGFRLLHDSAVPYFRQTTKAWYDRFSAQQSEALRLLGVREFNRHLLLLTLYCRIAEDYAMMHRLTFEKPASA